MSNRIHNDIDCSNERNIEEFVRTSQKFILENEKRLEVSRENFHLQTTSTQTSNAPILDSKKQQRGKKFAENHAPIPMNTKPHPPDGTRPAIKKSLSSQRMAR